MAFEMKSAIIDGIDFKVVQFPAIEAYKIKHKLAKLIAPVLTSVIGGVKTGENVLDSKIDMKMVSDAFISVLSELSENDFIELLKRLLASTSCTFTPEGKNDQVMIDFVKDFEDKMNMIFTGKTFTIYPLIFFILKVNYPDFFVKVEGIGSRVKTFMSAK